MIYNDFAVISLLALFFEIPTAPNPKLAKYGHQL